ncbi:beta-propeller fold lactonase family protein [Actinospica sp.]|jgi:YVTN family beta-propeller protein|uniref:beta-propeller fold lactonase family protein n=1 Tax=Actinospica sp. TaxID=1872142 RepID=UPI002BC51560|nr:beta-propeller fold lactonase family protein [Actinospica sp.]HWG26406.1 beta-propeller fold lactonase family protein [Actinospica sp.]
MTDRPRQRRSHALTCAVALALVLGAAGTSAAEAAASTTNTASTTDTATTTNAASGAAATAALATPRLYVTSGSAGTLTGVDATTGAVRTKAELTQPRGVGFIPLQLASSRNRQVIYVLCDGSDGALAPSVSGTLVAVDANTDQVTGTAPIGFNANGFVLSRDGGFAYVTGPRDVFKVDLATMSVVGKFADPNLAASPALSGDGSKLYVVDAYGKDVVSLDTSTMTASASIAVSSNLRATALSSDGTELYVLNDTRRLTVLNTSTDAVVATVATAANTDQLTMSPEGSRLYVTGRSAGVIDVVNTATNKFYKKIAVGAFDGVRFSPSGKTVYAVGGGATTATLSIINQASEAVESSVSITGQYESLAVSPNGEQVWVNGPSSIATVDTKTGTVVATLDTPRDDGVAFGGKAGNAFVAEELTNTLNVYDSATLRQVATVPAAFRFPSAVAVTPNGETAYVTSQSGSTVRAVNLVSGTPTADISVGDGPSSITATPDGEYVLVVNNTDSTLSVIATSTDTVVATVSIPAGATEVRVSPDSQTAYVLGGANLTYVELSTFQVAATVKLAALKYTEGLALSPDGSTAYVDGGATIDVVDTATQTVTRTLTEGTAYNEGLAVSPDGSTLYIAGGAADPNAGTLYAVDIASGMTTASVTVGQTPYGVVLNAAGTRAYVANEGSNDVSVVDTSAAKLVSTWKFGTDFLESPIDGIFYSTD